MRMRRLQTASEQSDQGVRLIRVADLQPGDIAAWQALVLEALEPNPFFEPEFVLPLADARPKDDVHLLIAEQHGSWAVCLPVVKRWKWRKLPVPVLATWLSQYTFLGTPLVAASKSNPLLQLIAGAHRAHKGLLILEWVGADGLVSALLRNALAQYHGPAARWERFERAALRRTANCDLGMSTRGRADYRRRRRALERECGGALQLVNLAGDPSGVEAFLALEAAGWKGDKGTAIGSHASDAEFFRKACHDLAAAGRLQLLALTGSRAVAMQCNFISGDVVFGFRTCFDESLARYSPGALILLESLAVFHETNAVWFDSCTHPRSELCNRLMRDRRLLETTIVGADNGIGSALMAGITMASMARYAQRSVKDAARYFNGRHGSSSSHLGYRSVDQH
jgi:CelD/BcsL family acetyltransferase involved in cellulose biosynthesis